MEERLHTTLGYLTRAEIQAHCDALIERLNAEGQPVPQTLYHWGRLMPDERDRERARRRLAQPDLAPTLAEARRQPAQRSATEG